MRTLFVFLILTSVANAQLVDDSRKPHVSIFLDEDWQEDLDQVALHDLVKEAASEDYHFHVYTPDDTHFKVFKRVVTKTPTIIVQRYDGWVALKISGKNIPRDPRPLIKQCYPTGPNLPTPEFDPELRPRPPPETVPEGNDKEEKESLIPDTLIPGEDDSKINTLILVVLVVGVVLIIIPWSNL